MRRGWMHTAGFEGQERFAPRTLADSVYIDESLEQTVAGKLNTVSNEIAGLPSLADISEHVLQQIPPVVIPEFPVRMRYVNAQGEMSQAASENVYLQIQHPVEGVWEWVDLPHMFNVEYRTRERFDSNKIVYSKLVNCGKLANNNLKAVRYANNNVVDFPVRVEAWIARHIHWMRPLPLATHGNDNIGVDIDRVNIRFRTYADWSNYSTIARVWYTKVVD